MYPGIIVLSIIPGCKGDGGLGSPRFNSARGLSSAMTRTLKAMLLIVLGTPAVMVEQTRPGAKPPPALIASFDGLGAGFVGPQGISTQRNPSDNSLAVGPDHVMQIINTRLAIFTKTGTPSTGRSRPGPSSDISAAPARLRTMAMRWLATTNSPAAG